MGLGLALAGLALLALAAGRLLAGYPPSAYAHLWRHEAAFVAAAGDALFPPGGAIPESGREAGIPDYADRYLAALPPRQRVLIRLLFVLMEHATLVFPAPPPGGRRRFSALAPEQQVAALDAWRTSPLELRRTVFLALRSLLTMAYFGCPAVLRRLDLAPLAVDTPVVEADLLLPPVGRTAAAIRARPEDVTGPGVDRPPGPDAPVHPPFAARAEGSG